MRRPPGFAPEARDDPRGRRLHGSEIGLQTELAQRAGGLGSAGDLAHPGEGHQNGSRSAGGVREAPEDAAQSLPGGQNQVIELPGGQPGRKFERRGRVGCVADGDQGAAQHLRAAPLEQRGKHLQLARFGDGHGTPGQGLRFHAGILAAPPPACAPEGLARYAYAQQERGRRRAAVAGAIHGSPGIETAVRKGPRAMFKVLSVIVLVILVVLAGITWLSLTWVYSDGERAGYAQKFSCRG